MLSLTDLYNMRNGGGGQQDLEGGYAPEPEQDLPWWQEMVRLKNLVDYGQGQFEQGTNGDLAAGFPAATHLAKTITNPMGAAGDTLSSGARAAGLAQGVERSVVPRRLAANDSNASLPSLLGNTQEQQDGISELQAILGQYGLLDQPPHTKQPLRLWPEQRDDNWWEQFQDDELYKGVPREQIPPSMRPPIDVPDVDPEFYYDRWRRKIS